MVKWLSGRGAQIQFSKATFLQGTYIAFTWDTTFFGEHILCLVGQSHLDPLRTGFGHPTLGCQPSFEYMNDILWACGIPQIVQKSLL